jgi:hypothetical protein
MASIDKRANGGSRTRSREYPAALRRPASSLAKARERFLDGVRGDIARGLYVDPKGGRTLVQAFAEKCQPAGGSRDRPRQALQRLEDERSTGLSPLRARQVWGRQVVSGRLQWPPARAGCTTDQEPRSGRAERRHGAAASALFGVPARWLSCWRRGLGFGPTTRRLGRWG